VSPAAIRERDAGPTPNASPVRDETRVQRGPHGFRAVVQRATRSQNEQPAQGGTRSRGGLQWPGETPRAAQREPDASPAATPASGEPLSQDVQPALDETHARYEPLQLDASLTAAQHRVVPWLPDAIHARYEPPQMNAFQCAAPLPGVTHAQCEPR